MKINKKTVGMTKGASGLYEIKEGVRQGDALSSIIFSLALEKVVRNAELDLYYT